MKTRLNNVVSSLTILLLASLLCGCPAAIKVPRIQARADQYFKVGEYEKAKIEYMNVLRLDQRNVSAYRQIGLIWLEQGAPLHAVPFLAKVIELTPNDLETRQKLALSYLAIGRPGEARKQALVILRQEPANGDALVVLADSARKKEEVAETQQYLQQYPTKDASYCLANGTLLLHAGNVAAAQTELERGLETEPSSVKLHFTLGFLYVLRRDNASAEKEFKTAADLSSIRSAERLKYAEFEAANGNIPAANAVLNDMTRQAPDYLAAWQAKSRIAYAEKKYDEALSILENVLSRDPDNPDGRLLQSEILVAKNDSAKALSILERLNAIYPGNAMVNFTLAQAYLKVKKPELATAALERAVSANPDFVEAIVMLGQLNSQAQKYQAVVTSMEPLLSNRPDILEARLLLADAYIALGKPDQAVSLFLEQIQKNPQNGEAYFRLGQVLRQQKRNEDARRAFEKAAELAPDNLDAINQLVEIDLAEKRYDDAMRRVEAQLRRNPNVAGVYYMQATVFAAQQKWPEAEAAAQKSIALDANLAAPYNVLLAAYVAQHKLSEALAELENGLKKTPDNSGMLLSMALIYENMGDYAKARDCYEKLLTAGTSSPSVLNNLAYIYAEHLIQLDRAYELAQKARDLLPTDGSAADTLGWVLYKKGDYQKALALLQEAASKLPDNPEVQFHLGMTAYMMGDAAVARTALEKAANGKQEFSSKDEARRRLVALQNPSSVGSPPAGSPGAGTQPASDLMMLMREAEVHEQKGEATQAAATYEQILKLNSQLTNVLLKLAQLYAGPLQKNDKALEFAKKARELAPNDPQTAAIAGRVAFQSGNFIWAYSLLQDAARKNSDNPAVLYEFALAAYALGKEAEARKNMERVVTLQPNGTQAQDANIFLAMTALERPSPEAVAAESQVEKILKEKPDYVPALMVKAAIKLQGNDTKSATAVYVQVLQKYPEFAPAQKRLAAIYSEDRELLAKAYDLAMKARKTLPEDPELARILARLSFRRNEFAYATQLFQESAMKDPLSAEDLFLFGMAQLQNKQDAKGRESLERALSAGLQGPLAEEAKKRLAAQKP